MRYKILLAVFFLTGQISYIYGQDTYIKKIDREETIRARQIIKYENRLFIMNTGVCNQTSECSTIMEIDEYGNIIWERRLPWLDVSSKSMVIEHDTIFLSGNYNQTQQKFLFHQMSIDGGEALATYDIVKPDDIYTNMFNLGMLKIEDRFYIYGAAIKENSAIASSIIYAVDSRGNLDTLLSLFPTDLTSAMWQMREDNQGNAVAFMILDSQGFGPGEEDYRKIIKLNNEYEIIWEYTSGDVNNDFATPKAVILDDDRIVYVTGNENFNLNQHSLRALNLDSTISWQYYSPTNNSNHRKIFNVELASDGNIFGFGEWGLKTWNPKIDQTPWIFKMSKEGEMIWERAYYELREGQALAKFGLFFDAVELDDGSIMAVGGMRSDNSDILIARFDSEGCLMFGCNILNDVTDVLSDVEDVQVGESIKIYPNPSMMGEDIIVSIDGSFNIGGDYTIEVYHSTGELIFEEMLKAGTHNIMIDSNHKGLFFVRIKDKDKTIFTDKIIRR